MPLGLDPATSGLVTAGLIGLLIGVQRESVKTAEQPGARDFLLISLAGGAAGLLQSPAVTISLLAAVVAIMLAFHMRAGRQAGITTELAAVITYVLGYLASQRTFPQGWVYAVSLAIVVAFFLESKEELHEFLERQFTEVDFLATLKFLALIFLIYPLLPPGDFGPYAGFNLQLVWKFVILVSSISFLGYLLQKFLGEEQGLRAAALLGGLASTTAATAAFAKRSRETPEKEGELASATILANAVQFPRVWAIVAAINFPFAVLLAPLLALLTFGGVLTVWLFGRLRRPEAVPLARSQVTVRNPMRLKPALLFGGLFALIMMATKAAHAEFGRQAVMLTSVLGGALDTDAVVVSLSELHQAGTAKPENLLWAVFGAMLANAVVKASLAVAGGTRRYCRSVLLGFAGMFGGGAVLALFWAQAGPLHLW